MSDFVLTSVAFLIFSVGFLVGSIVGDGSVK